MLLEDAITEFPPYMPRAISYSERLDLLYIGNQRAGSTSIKLWMMRIDRNDPELDIGPNVHRDNFLTQFKALGEDGLVNLLNGPTKTFTFVRHPISRLASSFAGKVMNPGAPRRNAFLTALGEREAGQTVPIDQFLDYLEGQDPAEIDPHYRPQAINTLASIVKPDFIGKLESFAEDIATMADRFDLPRYPVPAANVGKRTEEKNSVQAEILSRPDILARVRRLYAEDFETFGYD